MTPAQKLFAICFVASVIFDAIIISGATYLVFWMGQSGWWYLLAILFMIGASPATAMKALKYEQDRIQMKDRD